MSGNSFGNCIKLSSFGESHAKAVGMLLDGFPAGLEIDLEKIQIDLNRRRPGKHDEKENLQSDRKEADRLQVLSGIFEGKSLGTPIGMLVENLDARSQDYNKIKSKPRPGHADDTWTNKFGLRDHRGGGRASARETVARVMAGSLCNQLICHYYPTYLVKTFVSQIGEIKLSDEQLSVINNYSFSQEDYNQFLDKFPARFPGDEAHQTKVLNLLRSAKENGKSYGGKIKVVISSAPASLGQPVFHKIKSDLASAMLSIPASNSFALGNSELTHQEEGSRLHKMEDASGEIYGGIRGGISTGENIVFEVGFKPTSSVLDVAKSGRHDPCILPRAVAVVQAMTNLVVADHLLWARLDKI